jgi:hypothetical protein
MFQITLADLVSLVFLLSDISKLFGIRVFWLWSYLIKINLETHHALYIWYLLSYHYNHSAWKMLLTNIFHNNLRLLNAKGPIYI